MSGVSEGRYALGPKNTRHLCSLENQECTGKASWEEPMSRRNSDTCRQAERGGRGIAQVKVKLTPGGSDASVEVRRGAQGRCTLTLPGGREERCREMQQSLNARVQISGD